jgi:hypothetical protein
MRKIIFLLAFIADNILGISQNSVSGTGAVITHSTNPTECNLTSGTTRFGNGTVGRVEVCLTANMLSSSCGGGNNKNDQIYIYDDSNNDGVPDNIIAIWTPLTALNTCVLSQYSTGYIWLFFCPDGGAGACDAGDKSNSSVTVSWNTYSTPSNNLISGALTVNQCGTAFTANNIGATASENCDGYVGNTGPPTNQTVPFDNNLDCNNATSSSTSPYNTAGGDVNYSVENDIFYKFCPAVLGTWVVTLSKVKCYSTSGGGPTSAYGYQYALFQGTSSNLGATIAGGTSGMNQTGNTTINVVVTNTTNCYFLQIDGYGGTGCVFNFNLTAPSGVCTILPVELIYFSAYRVSNFVNIDWSTASERENQHFVLEKSNDGINFEEIFRTKGGGDSHRILNYNYRDESRNPNGIAYYRLVQYDFSGIKTYSQIISVEDDYEFLETELIPNPNIENVSSKIIFNKVPNEEVTVSISDMNGVLLFESIKKMEENKFEIPSNFSKGVYVVKVKAGDFYAIKRMIIK